MLLNAAKCWKNAGKFFPDAGTLKAKWQEEIKANEQEYLRDV